MALEPVGGGGGASAAYTPVAIQRTFRVNADGTFTPVVNVTAISTLYGVQFTFTMLASVWDADGGPPLTELRTEWVNAVCAYDHVVGFHTEVDQGTDQILYNYGVITVGTADASITDEVRVRMDHLNDQSTFAAVDAAWKRLQAMGAS